MNFWATSLLLVFLFASCTKKEGAEPAAEVAEREALPVGSPIYREPTYALCSEQMTRPKVLEMINGNLVFVGEQMEKGRSLAEMMTGLVATLIINGLKFPGTYDYDFEDGDYTYKNGDVGYTFAFYYVEDFGSAKAGDKISHNLFDLDSYIQDVSVSIFPSIAYDYEEGPLFDLIEGSASMEGLNLSSLEVELNVRTDLIAFGLSSENDYNGSEPRVEDILHLEVTNTPLALSNIRSQIDAGTFGLDYAGSAYDSIYYDVLQTFDTSIFFLKSDSGGGYYLDGEYLSVVTKDTGTLYQKGIASHMRENYTEYYCDAERAELVGTARHDSDLLGGSFEFADGTEIEYGLEDF